MHASLAFYVAIAIISCIIYQVLTSQLIPRGAVRSLIFTLLLFSIFAIGLKFGPVLLAYAFSNIATTISVYGGNQIVDSTNIDASTWMLNNLALIMGSIISIISILKDLLLFILFTQFSF